MLRRDTPVFGARAPASPALAVLSAVPFVTVLVLRPGPLTAVALAASVAVFAVRRPAAAVLLLVPINLLGAALAGIQVSFAVIATVTFVAVVRVAAGDSPLGRAQMWAGLLACLLLISYLLPAVPSEAESARIVDLLGMLTGLGLLGAVAAAPVSARRLAQVTALSGGLAACQVLLAGEFAEHRLSGLGQNPNYLGTLMVLPVVAGVGSARVTRNPAWLIPAAAGFAALSQTQSRGAFIAVTVGVAALFLQGRSRSIRWAVLLAVVGLAVMYPGSRGAVEHAAAGDRKSVELRDDNAARRRVAEFAVHVAAEHPFRGVGFGMFAPYAEKDPRFGYAMATHNDFLELAAEDGVGALAAFGVLLWSGLHRRRSGYLVVLRAVVAAYAVGLLFCNPLGDFVVSLPFWLALGRLLARDGEGGVPAETVTAPSEHEGGSADGRGHDAGPDEREVRFRQELDGVRRPR